MGELQLTLDGARDLVRQSVPIDFSCEVEFAETEDFWLVPVNSLAFYKTGLLRHSLDETWIHAVTKDGTGITRPFTAGVALTSQLAALGPRQTLIESSLWAGAPSRVDDRWLFASQPAEVLQEWLPQLHYFTLEVGSPADGGQDHLRATILWRDPADAVRKLRALGVAADEPIASYDLTAVNQREIDHDHYGWTETSAGPAYVRLSKAGYLDITILGTAGITQIELTTALAYEHLFDSSQWRDDLIADPPWHSQANAVTRGRYPELFARGSDT